MSPLSSAHIRAAAQSDSWGSFARLGDGQTRGKGSRVANEGLELRPSTRLTSPYFYAHLQIPPFNHSLPSRLSRLWPPQDTCDSRSSLESVSQLASGLSPYSFGLLLARLTSPSATFHRSLAVAFGRLFVHYPHAGFKLSHRVGH